MIFPFLCFCAAALVGFLALECWLGATRRGAPATPDSETRPSFTVLMPAYDEARGISGPIQSVLTQLSGSDRLLVVADNCSDDTAQIARAMGAEVIERFDQALRGKGYALEFARAHLRDGSGHASPGDIIIVLDADCVAEPGALAHIAATAFARDGAVQGAYLLVPPAEASAKVRISCFAFLIKNLVRQRALDWLAGAALLQGSGMAFPRRIFDTVEWCADSLVEDLDMGLDLLLAGERVCFEDSAIFVSDASSDSGTVGQRRRWEHGMLRSMRHYGPALLRQAVNGRPRLGWVAFDLMIPPTVMLFAGSLLTLALGVAVLGLASSVVILAVALGLLGAGLARAWSAEGRVMLPMRSIVQIPAYIFWKLPIAVQFFTRREKRWIRTERNP